MEAGEQKTAPVMPRVVIGILSDGLCLLESVPLR
jgi:hypothetical protein